MLPCLNFAVVLCVFQVLCITADIDTSSFLIFNEEHNKCIKVESATSITVDDCNPYAKDQQFRWVSESHLFSLSLKLCLGTTAIEDGVIVQFMKCDESNDLQHWQCKNDTLFGLKDQDLHLNWGHRHDERVMIHKGSGTWSRWRIYGTQGDLCSKGYQVVGPTAPPQLPGNCPQSTSRGTWIPFSGHCYSFFSSVTNDWAHATTECIKMGASLVSIQDPIESKFIEENVEILQDSAKTFWIGMYKTHEDKWMWIDNSPLDYTNWNSGMAESESCVYINSYTGLWSTTYCRKSFSYICKTPKVIKPTEKPPFVAHVIQETTHGSAGIIVAIVLIVIAIVGLGAFLLFRKRIPRIPAPNLRESTFDNKLYFNNPNRAAVDTKGLVANIEQNEQT